MSEQHNGAGGDLLFAWLTPIEAHVDKKLHRPRSPSLNSPLLRAKTAIRRTFSAGQRAQRHKEQGTVAGLQQFIVVQWSMGDELVALQPVRPLAVSC